MKDQRFIAILTGEEGDEGKDAEFRAWDAGNVRASADSLGEHDRLALLSWLDADPVVGTYINVSFGTVIRAPSSTPIPVPGWHEQVGKTV